MMLRLVQSAVRQSSPSCTGQLVGARLDEMADAVGKTVVVTGANGFIASWVVKLLLERGYTVRGAVRNPGATKEYTNFATGCVNVRDTALAHVLAYETPSAEGRYILSKTVVHFEDIAKILKNICPGYPIPSKWKGTAPKAKTYSLTSEKAENLRELQVRGGESGGMCGKP